MLSELLKDKDKRIYACEKSLMLFSIYYFTEYHKYKMPDFHKDWYNAFLNKQILSLITFRESAKTSLAKIKLIHDIVYKKKKLILWVSFDKSKAKSNLFDIAIQLQTNKKLINDFGQLFFDIGKEEKSTKKSIDEFITENDIKVKAFSTGQTTRGENYKQFRPDLIILDDIENLDTIDSEPKTEQVKRFMDELLGGLDANAQIIVLGNRLTNNGSITYFEDKVRDNHNAYLCDIPVIKDGVITWDSKYCHTDKESEATGKVSLESKIRILGYQAYNREMLNIPITPEEQEFRKEWFRYITRQEVEAKNTRRFLTIDPAMSKDTHADYTGFCENYVDIENFWNISAYRMRLNPKELVDYLFTIHDKRQFEIIGIEKTAYLVGLKSYIDDECRKRNKFLPIVELSHNQTAKETRIRGLIPRYSSYSIKHIDKECKDLEDELFSFPRSIHDDTMDATAYQSFLAEKPSNLDQVIEENGILYSDIGI